MRSKIHRATVTECDLNYIGSLTLDQELMRAADIVEHERVQVVDVDSGARFETYVIAGTAGSGEVCVNGAAARLVHRGDTVIVIAYGYLEPGELVGYEPAVVHVEAGTNRIVTVDSSSNELARASSPL